ncbi:MAG: SDR family oxidoreductase [Lachnospiraceae bacterium]|nr:SDR family oxidoreductase [Lachnospiraceae bacterium]
MKRYALITGASRGIGKSLALEFAKAGYNLYLTCVKSIESLMEYAEHLAKTYGIKAKAFQVDGVNYENVTNLFAEINDLDVLINNAGIAHFGLLTDMTPEEWNHMIATNLTSAFYTCKHAVPLMVAKHQGCIINISSVWGNVGASMEVAYSASKGGLNSFTKALAKELAPSGITVNAIACGVIDTDMNRKNLSSEDLDALAAEIPADRLGTPEEVAKLALQLASSPTYLTGQIITMDGGWY